MLLQVLTILFPIFIIQVLLLKYNNIRQTPYYPSILGGLGGLTAILCMMFPVHLVNGFIWDFRWIPLITVTFYGGRFAGALAIVLCLSFRYLLGGDALMIAMIGNILFVLVPFWTVRNYYKRSRKQRYAAAVGISLMAHLLTIALLMIYLSYQGQVKHFEGFIVFVVIAGTIQLLLMVLTVFFVENANEMVRIRDEAQRTEKLTLISELAASVAHEVRNPLTVVKGFIQIARSSADEKVQRYMTTAISELDRAESIISDYLNLAKPQHDRDEPVSISELVQATTALMASFANMQGMELQTEVEQELWVRGDPVKLKQVIINLIKNAIEATKGSESIIVQACMEKHRVMIRIIDSGEGMTEEQLLQLGNTFYTTKEKGTGLGVMVALRIVEAMEGELEFRSEKGKGTTATIRLPAFDFHI